MCVIWLGLSASAGDLKLWYSRPAGNWTEALPVGNSRLGAMVYGGTGREDLQLNEETFWAGSPYDNNNPNARYVLPVIRQLIFEGKNREAQSLVDANFFSGKHGMSYLPVGSLFLDFEGHDRATDFYRDLDLSTATATTRYKVDGVDYARTVFASFADSVIIVRLEAGKGGELDFKVSFDAPLEHSVKAADGTLSILCQGREQERVRAGLHAECRVKVLTDGAVAAAGEALEVAGELHAVDAVRENADEEVERGEALLPIAEHDAPGHLLVAVEHAERAGFVGAERLDEVVDKGGHELALPLAVTPVSFAAPAVIALQVGHDEAVRRAQEAAEGVFLAALESMIVTHGITF